MKRQRSIRFRSPIQLLAVPLVAGGLLLNSAHAAAEDPIPFKTMMQQPASAQTAVPPMPAATTSSVQPVNKGHVTNGGKGMIVGGFVLLGAGVFTIALTAALNRPSHGYIDMNLSSGVSAAAYAGGACAAVGGVTLVTFGFHKRSAR